MNIMNQMYSSPTFNIYHIIHSCIIYHYPDYFEINLKHHIIYVLYVSVCVSKR